MTSGATGAHFADTLQDGAALVCFFKTHAGLHSHLSPSRKAPQIMSPTETNF
jgi:hypothetical protein